MVNLRANTRHDHAKSIHEPRLFSRAVGEQHLAFRADRLDEVETYNLMSEQASELEFRALCSDL
jgi:hypothetical protein